MTEPDGESKTVVVDEDWREVTEKMTTDKQYQYMQENGIFTDCTFVVGPDDGETREFKAHRVYIARVSPVFEAMLLRGEMIEAKTGHVRVTDLSPSTFHLLLNSIYGKEPESTSYKEAEDLAFAAHKYQIKALLQNCVMHMSALITPENVWTAFETADLLQEARLKEMCVQVLQCNTLRCIKEPGFMQTSEENVALLLEQDEMNVDDEPSLVNIIVQWALRAAVQRGLSGDDSGVRAVLEPRLLKLFRFLAMSPQQFMLGPGLAGWLTDDEKSAIEDGLQSGNFSKWPQHLSPVAKKRKNAIFTANAVQIQGKRAPENFVCKREVIGSRPNVQQTQNKCCLHPNVFNTKVYFHCTHATLVLKVNSSCKLLGVQCSSRCRADGMADPTAFVAKKPFYHELMIVNTYNFNHTLSTDFQKSSYTSTMSYSDSKVKLTDYNSTITFLFNTPVSFNPNNWFAIEVKFLESGNSPGQYPNPKRYPRVCTAAGVEFEFRTEEQEGFHTSENDGIFESLIFSP